MKGHFLLTEFNFFFIDVTTFQKANGLVASGVFDEPTAELLLQLHSADGFKDSGFTAASMGYLYKIHVPVLDFPTGDLSDVNSAEPDCRASPCGSALGCASPFGSAGGWLIAPRPYSPVRTCLQKGFD